ncbi:MAG: class I SAM-dependent methyltransferase [Beijerinckiaceae bacterium]|nr:class I SAM-dependent methyltransferase [Beijerinckiaceae bacterium]
MKRIPEAEELMDLPHQALAYARADFTGPNTIFVDIFAAKFPSFNGGKILDLGCGPADITMRFAWRYPQAKVLGLDGAAAMLDIARKVIASDPSLAGRVNVGHWHIGIDPNPPGAERFDAVVSNSLLHHMRDPLGLWRAIRACAAPGAPVLVMDLFRPQSRAEAEEIVAKYAGQEPEILRRDFLTSLLAAYRPAEILEQLKSVKLDSLRIEVATDRHLIVSGLAG